MKRLFIIVLVSFVMFSCSDDSSSLEIYNDTRKQTEEWDGGATKMTNHFIDVYLVPDEIKVVHSYDGEIALAIIGEEYFTHFDNNYKHYEFVEYLSEFYNDIKYNGYLRGNNDNRAMAYPIDKMTMYCEEDFDAQHPAGKTVDDIVTFDFSSHYNFIQSGYKKNKNSDSRLQDVDCYTLHLNEVNADVATLLALQRTWMVFNFTSAPETPGEYTFTLEMTINGKVLKSTFTHTFE